MKNKGIIKLGIVVAILIVLYFIAGYFLGNLPIASSLLGTNKPRDLGVKISVDSAVDGLEALNKPTSISDLKAIAANPSSYTRVKATIDEAEASSLLSLGDIPDFPFKLVQINFGSGGEVQASGVLDINALQKVLEDYGASGEVVDQVMGIVKNAKYMTFYMEGNFSMTNNQLDAEVDSLQLGRINLPVDMVKDNSDSITNYVERSLIESGYNIRSIRVSDGNITFDMDRPISSIAPWLKMVEASQ